VRGKQGADSFCYQAFDIAILFDLVAESTGADQDDALALDWSFVGEQFFPIYLAEDFSLIVRKGRFELVPVSTMDLFFNSRPCVDLSQVSI
jgi:hypothetical protein